MIINLIEVYNAVWLKRGCSLVCEKDYHLLLLIFALCSMLASCSTETGGVETSGGADSGTNKQIVVPAPNLAGAEMPVIQIVNKTRQLVVHDINSVAAWGRFGMVCDAHSLYEDALQCYLRASQLDPKDHRWPYLIAAMLANEDPLQSINYFKRAIDIEPNSSAIRHTFADTLLRAGRIEEAEIQYMQSLKLDPENHKALLGLGEIAVRDSRLQEALQRFTRVLEFKPYDNEVHEKLARLYTRLGDTAKAEHEAMLVKAFPEKAPVLDPVRAEVAAEAVNSTSLIRRGLAHSRHGQNTEAEKVFRQILQTQPKHIKALLNLGAVLVKQGRTTEAIEQLNAALSVDEKNAEVHSNLGVALAFDKQVPLALKHIQTALDLDPNYSEAHYNLGWILQGQGKKDQAQAAYQQSLKLNPVNVQAHNNLGKLLALRGKLIDAVPHWKDAIAYSQNNPEALFNLAVAFIQLQSFGKAVTLFERGLKKDPNNLRMIAGLATLLATCPQASHRNGIKAVQLAEHLVQSSQGKHLQSLNLLAAAHAEAGDFDSAIRTAQQALALATTTKQAQLIQLTTSRLQLYQNRLPYHQPPKGSGLENQQAVPNG